MKGFLNKVQSKVAGKSPNAAAAVEAKPTHVESPVHSMVDPTPRADISLPRGRERRYIIDLLRN